MKDRIEAAVAILVALFGLAITIAMIYVAQHFITKYW